MAALEFCYTTLATGGHFLTKYYMGSEDQVFEKRLKRLFHKVHRIKPDSSRIERREFHEKQSSVISPHHHHVSRRVIQMMRKRIVILNGINNCHFISSPSTIAERQTPAQPNADEI
jgi:21S rRNA (uridine2791-2'-O)-methyltransferase